MNVTKRARTCRGLAILMTMLLLAALLPLSASAAETVSQHERVRVGFFAMDGYHMMVKMETAAVTATIFSA